jgi:hypothetical protein
MAEVVLVSIILTPAVLAFLLRSNVALSFLSLCAGFTVTTYASQTIQDWLNPLVWHLDINFINLAFMAAPLLLTLLLTRRSLSKDFRLFFHIILALGSGAILAIMVGVALSNLGLVDYTNSDMLNELSKVQNHLIVATALASLFFVWVGGLRKKHK